MKRHSPACPDCGPVDRRDFLKSVGGVALAGAASSWLMPGAYAAPTASSAAETTVGRFYASLSDAQKKTICFPFGDPLRQRINANWHITKPTIGNDFYSADQRKLIDEIVRNVTSAEGYELLTKQMDDDSGGIQDYSVAVFGEPGKSAFEWELTGRHLTLRADGNSVDQAAFGGPIVYGHGEEDPKANLFHYQTTQVNEVFRALDAKQAGKALVDKAPNEAAVALQGESGKFPGIAVSELSADQQALVTQTLKVLLAPYRQEDADEAMAILKATGGLDKLHMAFYQQGDLQNDKVWDIWRVEGPAFVWHFRGAPHVHAYINIGVVGSAKAGG
ncbi:DUF3500 domain-containing protein [Planctellipticum variicoloris]|uniref:DUF3500 domain-containing protein n=1 Tax=Planctellipticum variicoloris TaxID=3064265 RepID=UPI00301340DC|nr:DUF3500 domain-containing protein [Planctomycetaceae bacterium SH412]